MGEKWKAALEALLAAEPDDKEKGEIVATFVTGIDELLVEARKRIARNILNGDADDAVAWLADINELRAARRGVMKHPVISQALSKSLASLIEKALTAQPASRHGVSFL